MLREPKRRPLAQQEFPLDQVHRTNGTVFHFSWHRFLFTFFKSFQTFVVRGVVLGLGLLGFYQLQSSLLTLFMD